MKKGGFTKQLSMKENNKTSIKNKMSFKDTTINGNVGQDSRFENMPINFCERCSILWFDNQNIEILATSLITDEV